MFLKSFFDEGKSWPLLSGVVDSTHTHTLECLGPSTLVLLPLQYGSRCIKRHGDRFDPRSCLLQSAAVNK